MGRAHYGQLIILQQPLLKRFDIRSIKIMFFSGCMTIDCHGRQWYAMVIIFHLGETPSTDTVVQTIRGSEIIDNALYIMFLCFKYILLRICLMAANNGHNNY